MTGADRRWLEGTLSLIARLEKRGVIDETEASDLRSQAIDAANTPLPDGAG